MKKILFNFILIGALFVSSAGAEESVRTAEDVNREVILTYAQMQLDQKNYPAAEALIKDFFSKEQKEDPVLLQFLGDVQLLQRKLSLACDSYQKATAKLVVPKEKVIAKYQWANCLHRSGKDSEAIKILQGLTSESSGISNAPEQALSRLNAGMLRMNENLPPFQEYVRGRFRVSGAISSGYDSNVLLVEEDVARGTASSELGSAFVAPALQFGFVGKAFRDTFDSRWITSYTDYVSSTASSFNSLYTRLDFSFGSGPIRWGFFGDAFFLNRNPFNLYSYESGLSWTQLMDVSDIRTTTLEVPLQFQKYILSEGTDSANDRTGGDLKIKFTRRYLRGEAEVLSLQSILNLQYATGANYREIGVDLPAYWQTLVPVLENWGLVNTVNADLKASVFPNSDSKRKDLMMIIGTGVLKNFGRRWSVGFDFSAQKNLSTISSARYSKWVGSLQLSHDFL